MLNSKNQRMGILAGLLLFFGAWLTGYYNNWIWSMVTLASILVAFWVAVEDDSDEELNTRALRGFIAGVIAGVVARVCGMLAMVWIYGSWVSPTTVKYDSLSDTFRIFFNGDLWVSILAIIGIGAVGAFIAYAIPYFTAEKEEE